MLKAENGARDTLNKYLDDNCVFIEYHLGAPVELRWQSDKLILKTGMRVYKAKEIEFKSNKKYLIKITAKELDTVIPTLRVFRLDAYKKVDNV